MNATLYEPRVRRKPEARKPHATLRDRFASGVPIISLPLKGEWRARAFYVVYRVPRMRFSVN